ncbi:PatB family C-S lyase [Tropicibacter sp. R16_0]|uniref:MalY/PatB family protein n=1 Tax=Tropicibacter sp. R16_0 TaxID=2821102 RepID=UPI001AD9E10C|nr:PatB family C-S lyase [Tropicibacter sp. R16_0]MBO9449257.1 PatB family C-S lyase [Tropicibacter sp. R16_0]
MSQFEFDRDIDRRAVPALKTHCIVLGEGGEDLFAAGVADMDFAIAPAISQALAGRLSHPVLGYEAMPDGLIPALQAWQRDRHGWDIPAEHILRAPNALNILAIAVSLFSDPGDGVIVQPPVFFDFFDIIRENGRQVAGNPLILRDGRYEMDFDGFEALARDPRNKILFLCNPHNPIGRVWTRDELERLSNICLRHEVLIVADELHGDLTFAGHVHVPVASLGAVHAANAITILSPAKTFNIASCCSAFTVVPDEARRQAFQRENSRLTVNKNNAFANVAMEAAYRDGAPWLAEALEYVQGNLALVRDALAGMEAVDLIEPQGTFLLWLDFRKLGLAPDDLHAFLRTKARWAVTRGVSFDAEGAGFARLNIACPRDRLRRALDDLATAVNAVR